MPERFRFVAFTDMCNYSESSEFQKIELSMWENIMEEKIVLCGANAYDKKYYFNQKFDKIPDSIKDELHIICVLFTEEVGGIITLAFDEEGTLVIETNAAEEDYYYDEIGSGLLVREIRRKKQELFESLSLYYKVVILGEDLADLLDE